MLEDDVEERTLWVVWPTVPMGHPDEPVLDVLGYIMSYGRGTRLDEKLQLNGIATSNGAFAYAGDIDGQFITYASSEVTSLTKLDKVMRKEVTKITKKGPTPAEIERAVKAVRASLLDALENPVRRSHWIVDCHRYTGEPNCLGEIIAQYDAITPADIQRVAETYLTDDRYLTLSVVPRDDDGAMPGAVTMELP
jgi:zinc protease